MVGKMPFTNQSTVDSSVDFINSLEKPACNCKVGIRMCKHTPCIGTVDDIEKLMNAGYSKNLMLDWWVGEGTARRSLNGALKSDNFRIIKKDNPFDEDVNYLVPAVIGSEGKNAKFVKTGVCNLLIDDRCSVHDLDLKPVQGRLSCCKVNRVFLNEKGEHEEVDERIPILNTWNTQKGKDLIERWKKEVGFNLSDEKEGATVPKSMGELLDALFSIVGSHLELYDQKEGEDITNDNIPPKTVILQKTY